MRTGIFAFVACSMFSVPVMAQETVALSELIDSSEGYVNLRPGALIVEGDDGVFLCQIEATDDAFAAYAETGEASVEAGVCIPMEEFGQISILPEADGGALSELIDESEGYTNLRPSVVLIEGDGDIRFCKFDIADEVFANYAQNNEVGETVATCIPVMAFDDRSARVEGGVFSNMIDNSIGYDQLRPGVMMVETDEGSQFCQVNLSDAAFSAYGAEPSAVFEDGDVTTTCISSAVFDDKTISSGDASLRELIDLSEGYDNIRPDLMLIETEDGSHFCKIALDDNIFLAHSADKKLSTPYSDDDISAICIPAEEFNN